MKKKNVPSKARKSAPPSEMHNLASFFSGAIFVSVLVSVFLSFLLVRTSVYLGWF